MTAALGLAVSALAAVLAAASLAYLLLAHVAMISFFRRRTPPPLPEPAPPVSLMKPVEGADEHSHAAFRSMLDIDYPGPVQILVGTVRADDPIVAVVRRLQAEHPDRRIELHFAEVVGGNRKTSIMMELVKHATADVLVFADADVVARPNYLRWLVPAVLEAEVGCICLFPRGIACDSVGARLIALHYDFVYLPGWMLPVQTTGISWAIGHTMAQRREVFDAYGGFEPFKDALADDYEFAHRAWEQGKQVLVSPFLVDTYMPQEGFGASVRRLLRWHRTIRRVRPRSYAGLVATYPVAWTLVLALLNAGSAWAWPLLAAVVALRLALAWHLNASAIRSPEWPRLWWLLPLLDLVELYVFLAAYASNTIEWGGRRYHLTRDGRLEPK